MTDPTDPFGDLPDDIRTPLVEPPVNEKKLLELSVSWPDLSPGQAQLAEALRAFVITWDPLEFRPSRPPMLATANGTPASLDELVVYVPTWSLTALARKQGRTVADILSVICSTAVGTANACLVGVAAASREAGDALAVVQDALSQLGPAAAERPGYGQGSFRLVSNGWSDIGLGAITDIVQSTYGPIDLDRSPVELTATATPADGCPACRGKRF